MNQQTKYYITAAIVLIIVVTVVIIYFVTKNEDDDFQDATKNFANSDDRTTFLYHLEYSKNKTPQVTASFILDAVNMSGNMSMKINNQFVSTSLVPVKIYKSKKYNDRIQIRLLSKPTSHVVISDDAKYTIEENSNAYFTVQYTESVNVKA